ncbi:MAG: transcription termination/antitermination factor NusG [Bacteroidetes bacterium]|nr:transcription termination/antitermination factor NusG [Bacteroidota bacterium]
MDNTKLETGAKWYVLKVVTGQEKKVQSYIEAEFSKGELSSREIKILIPTEKVYEIKRGKKKVKEKQLFAGYVLLHVNLADGGQAVHVIGNVPGALGFMSARGWGFSKTPVPLRKSEINSILGKVEESKDELEYLERSFIIGEKVKVIDGPFSGFVGDIQAVYEDRKKVDVMVRIFERTTPVELSYVQIEKLS